MSELPSQDQFFQIPFWKSSLASSPFPARRRKPKHLLEMCCWFPELSILLSFELPQWTSYTTVCGASGSFLRKRRNGFVLVNNLSCSFSLCLLQQERGAFVPRHLRAEECISENSGPWYGGKFNFLLACFYHLEMKRRSKYLWWNWYFYRFHKE